jgi:hypothetical protein
MVDSEVCELNGNDWWWDLTIHEERLYIYLQHCFATFHSIELKFSSDIPWCRKICVDPKHHA